MSNLSSDLKNAVKLDVTNAQTLSKGPSNTNSQSSTKRNLHLKQRKFDKLNNDLEAKQSEIIFKKNRKNQP
jgi:hypothetical protein